VSNLKTYLIKRNSLLNWEGGHLVFEVDDFSSKLTEEAVQVITSGLKTCLIPRHNYPDENILGKLVNFFSLAVKQSSFFKPF